MGSRPNAIWLWWRLLHNTGKTLLPAFSSSSRNPSKPGAKISHSPTLKNDATPSSLATMSRAAATLDRSRATISRSSIRRGMSRIEPSTYPDHAF
jgi:hypothetical protein